MLIELNLCRERKGQAEYLLAALQRLLPYLSTDVMSPLRVGVSIHCFFYFHDYYYYYELLTLFIVVDIRRMSICRFQPLMEYFTLPKSFID
jgi:hypothetical protein